MPGAANSRDEWIGEVWQAIMRAKNAELLVLEFVAHLSVVCSKLPGIFAGIVVSAILHVPVLHRHRLGLFLIMEQAIKTMSGLTVEMNQFSPELSRDWKSEGKLNQILVRQGFLKLHISGADSVMRTRGKSASRRRKGKR